MQDASPNICFPFVSRGGGRKGLCRRAQGDSEILWLRLYPQSIASSPELVQIQPGQEKSSKTAITPWGGRGRLKASLRMFS